MILLGVFTIANSFLFSFLFDCLMLVIIHSKLIIFLYNLVLKFTYNILKQSWHLQKPRTKKAVKEAHPKKVKKKRYDWRKKNALKVLLTALSPLGFAFEKEKKIWNTCSADEATKKRRNIRKRKKKRFISQPETKKERE